jgi:hypothetical protein
VGIRTPGCHKDVRGHDVAVDDALFVRGIEFIRNLDCEVDR